MKHLFSIQNVVKKSIYCIHVWCTIYTKNYMYMYMLKFFFVMEATSLINFGKISIENLCIELKYKGDNVLGWGLFQKHYIRLRKTFLWSFIVSITNISDLLSRHESLIPSYFSPTRLNVSKNNPKTGPNRKSIYRRRFVCSWLRYCIKHLSVMSLIK